MEKGDLKIDEKTVVHCPTEELAKKVLDIAFGLGYRWSQEPLEYDTLHWNYFGKKTCYNLRTMMAMNVEYYVNYCISAEDFLKLHEDGVSEHAPIKLEKNLVYNIEIHTEDATKDQSILSEAQSILNGSRQADYGDAVDNFAHIASVVNTALRRDDITPELCCMVHIATKLCREGNRHKRDNLVDLAAYSDILNQIKERG